MVPFKYPVNKRMVTGLQNSYLPDFIDDSRGTQYEFVGVIEIVPLDRMEVTYKPEDKKQIAPFLAVGGKPPFVKKYDVTTTKKVAYDQLQKPSSDLHNVHYCMPVLLREEELEGRNIYIAVLHFYLGQRVLEVTHSSIQREYEETAPWVLLKHRIVHPMASLATLKGFLCDDPQTYEYHPLPDRYGSGPIEETIVWESLLDDVLAGK